MRARGGGLVAFDSRLVIFAGLRPRTTRSFCFGKRPQNHGRPGVAMPGGAGATKAAARRPFITLRHQRPDIVADRRALATGRPI